MTAYVLPQVPSSRSGILSSRNFTYSSTCSSGRRSSRNSRIVAVVVVVVVVAVVVAVAVAVAVAAAAAAAAAAIVIVTALEPGHKARRSPLHEAPAVVEV